MTNCHLRVSDTDIYFEAFTNTKDSLERRHRSQAKDGAETPLAEVERLLHMLYRIGMTEKLDVHEIGGDRWVIVSNRKAHTIL